MKLEEFLKICGKNYKQYCEYLIKKYGKVPGDYFCTETCKSPNPKIKRTKEGLFIHHIKEDKAIMLCNSKFAQKNPWEYQKAKNLLYCDYLEHLFLHFLITAENPKITKNFEQLGIGGIVNFIVPALNDYYSGYEIDPKRTSEYNAFEKVKNDYGVYFLILSNFCIMTGYDIKKLLTKSFGEHFGVWKSSYNKKLAKKGAHFMKQYIKDMEKIEKKETKAKEAKK